MDAPKYKRGDVVRFILSGKDGAEKIEKVGTIEIVDHRGSIEWLDECPSYDIMGVIGEEDAHVFASARKEWEEGYPIGGECLYKHIPEFEVRGLAE